MHKKGKYFLFLFYVCVSWMLYSLEGQAIEPDLGERDNGFQPATLVSISLIEDRGQVRQRLSTIKAEKFPKEVQKFIQSFNDQMELFFNEQSEHVRTKLHKPSILRLREDIAKVLRPLFGLKWNEEHAKWCIDEGFHQLQAEQMRACSAGAANEEAFYRESQEKEQVSKDISLYEKRRAFFLAVESLMSASLIRFKSEALKRKLSDNFECLSGSSWESWYPRNQEIVFFTVTPLNYRFYLEALKLFRLFRDVFEEGPSEDDLGPYIFRGEISIFVAMKVFLTPLQAANYEEVLTSVLQTGRETLMQEGDSVRDEDYHDSINAAIRMISSESSSPRNDVTNSADRSDEEGEV